MWIMVERGLDGQKLEALLPLVTPTPAVFFVTETVIPKS